MVSITGCCVMNGNRGGWTDVLFPETGGDRLFGFSGAKITRAKTFLIKWCDLPIAVLEVHSQLNNERVRLAAEPMRSRLPEPAINRNTTMKVIKIPVALGLLLTLAGGATQAVRAEDKPAAPAATTPASPKKPVQQQLSGKVVAVDKYGKTITLQVDNLTYVLQITDSTRVSLGGQDQSISDVTVGEELSVNVLLRELPDGRVEVAVLNVELLDSAEAQGRGHGKGHGRGGRGHGNPWKNPSHPFHCGPHPPNVDGPVVSPHR